jgi:Protein of unknown function (DUF4232)
MNEDRPMRLLLAALVAGLALAACGGSSTSSTSSTQAASTSSTTTSTAVTTTATATVTATSTASGSSQCRAADLSLTFLGQQGATGHGELGFALRNASGKSCTTSGFPGVLFLDRAGGALPTIPTHTTHDLFGSAPAVPLTVSPGATVSFRLGVTHGITSPAGCTTAYGLQVIPPNDTAALRTTIPDGGYECRTTTVSPLRPGTSAYP